MQNGKNSINGSSKRIVTNGKGKIAAKILKDLLQET